MSKFVYRMFRRYQKLKKKILYMLPDYFYLKLVWKKKSQSSTRLNLKNPKGFNEKLNWLKLYNRKPEYTMMTDKYAVREWVSKTIGEEYLVPLLAVYNNADEIDFDLLPEKFVLKCNHNSGEGMCICREKNALNKKIAVERLNVELKKNYYYENREWVYKNITPRIVCEKYLEGQKIDEFLSTIVNYKFYCFNGDPEFLYVSIDDTDSGAKGKTKLNMLDVNWKTAPFFRSDHSGVDDLILKPDSFDEMLTVCRKLSKDIPFVRVDLYCIKNKIYFSEMTFFPAAGFALFSPLEWEKKIGDLIELPKKKIK